MKLIINRKKFTEVLNTVMPAVAAKATLSVLTNFVISAPMADGNVAIKATNLEFAIIAHAEAQIEQPGEITVPAKTLIELMNACGGDDIHLDTNPKTVKMSIEAGATKANLSGIVAEEFPPITFPDSLKWIFISGASLKWGLSHVSPFASEDMGRPTLMSVSIQSKGEQLEIAAVDGFRIGVVTLPMNTELKALLPIKSARALLKLIPADQVEVAADLSCFYFRTNDVFFKTSTIEGNFPPYEQVIPRPALTDPFVIFESADLVNSLKRAAVFSPDTSNLVKLSIGGGKIVLSSESEETGNLEDEIPATTNGAMEVAFNVQYLREAAEACGGKVKLTQESGTRPALIVPVDDPMFLTVLMPMHLDGKR